MRPVSVLIWSLEGPPLPPIPDHFYQRVPFPVAQGCSALRRAQLCLAEGGWGDPGYTSPAFVLGVAVAFYMILTSLWWIKVLHTEKQLM